VISMLGGTDSRNMRAARRGGRAIPSNSSRAIARTCNVRRLPGNAGVPPTEPSALSNWLRGHLAHPSGSRAPGNSDLFPQAGFGAGTGCPAGIDAKWAPLARANSLPRPRFSVRVSSVPADAQAVPRRRQTPFGAEFQDGRRGS
jgi:hypothetical protein